LKDLSNGTGPMHLSIDPEALRPLVREIVAEVLAQVETARASLPDRLAFSEPEAARLLGLAPHQLRDERQRGRIAASQVVGRRVRYLREDLLAYLTSRRTEAAN
jgi:hypothetical protein